MLKEFEVSYYSVSEKKDVAMQFETHVNSPLTWLKELAQDPKLKDDFTWYPVEKFRVDGETRLHFVDEPMAAKDAHSVQVMLFLLNFYYFLLMYMHLRIHFHQILVQFT